jgi:hypothetical protein
VIDVRHDVGQRGPHLANAHFAANLTNHVLALLGRA